MVTKPNNQTIPPTHEGMDLGPKSEPATIASGAATGGFSGIQSKSPNPADGASKDFKLPNSISTKEIRDNSFRYGGGRSAGNRSLVKNQDRKEKQP